MSLQRTIRQAVTARGVGVHRGLEVSMTMRPAPKNTGVVFRRTDVTPMISIPAISEYVVDTRLSTCLGKDGAQVSTIEHLLSAIYGLGIDNLYIDIDAPEVPIMDGSAVHFVFLLKAAGIVNQANSLKKYIRILKPVEVHLKDKSASLKPCDGFKLGFKIDFNHPNILPKDSILRVDFSSLSFIHDIARARTFGFIQDIEALQMQNLALGGSLKNSIVLNEREIINPEGLRFVDEFVRHKILDAIGDLALFGAQVIGEFEGFKSGHMMNNLLIKKVLSDDEAWELVSYDESLVSPVIFDV